MLQQDPPDHTRLRGLVVKAFTARRVEDMRPRIQQIVDATLDRVEPQGHMDLIADFAFRLPVTVICEMLGIPEEDHELFFHGRAHRRAAARSRAALARRDRRGQRRQHWPRPSISAGCSSCGGASRATISRAQLVQAEEEGNKLSNEELTANIILLFGAGHETTVNLIGNGLLALHRNPDQLRLLQGDPSLIANAIEEFLRYDSSVQLTGRTALEDVAVGGTDVAEGRDGPVPARRRQSRSGRLCRPRPARYHAPEHPPACRSAAASISASAPSSRASRPRSPLPRCCAACRI